MAGEEPQAARSSSLRARAEQWRRFNEWELDQSGEHAPGIAALTWMSEAWDLAQRADPRWAAKDTFMEHVGEIERMRAALERAWPPR